MFLKRVAAGRFALAAAVLMICVSSAAAADPTDVPPPAVYTERLSFARAFTGDTFEYRGGLQPTLVRLSDVTCEGLPDKAREGATEVMKRMLEEEPCWVFPARPIPSEGGGEVEARIWTSKGWLSEVLVKARFVKRRGDIPLSVFEPLAAPTVGPADPPEPFKPAVRAVIDRFLDGERFEARLDGSSARACRLFDITTRVPGGEGAADAAARYAGKDPLWIFPSSQRRVPDSEDLPVRVWTPKGWLSDLLRKDGLARVYADPDKAEVEVASPDPTPTHRPTPTPTPRPTPTPVERPPEPDTGPTEIAWRTVPLQLAKSDSLSCETRLFEIPTRLWRMQWNLTPVREGGYIKISIFWVRPEWHTRTAHNQVRGFGGVRGQGVVEYKPGSYYMRITGTNSLSEIKVEYPERVPASP